MMLDLLLADHGPMMTIDELAVLLKIKRGTIYHQIAQNRIEIPFKKIGKAYLFQTEDVANFLAAA